MIFPKTLINGPAEASYGIYVGALAGLPEEVVQRAKDLLEAQGNENDTDTEVVKELSERPKTAPLLFDPGELILDSLADIDLNNLTPLNALKLLSDWQDEIKTNR